MKQQYTAIIKQDGDCRVGWIEEVSGVNCEERMRDALIESLRVALSEVIEFNRQDALEAAGSKYEGLALDAR
jgi:hypothetical protein